MSESRKGPFGMLKKLAILLALVGVCGVALPACTAKENEKPAPGVEDAKDAATKAAGEADKKADAKK